MCGPQVVFFMSSKCRGLSAALDDVPGFDNTTHKTNTKYFFATFTWKSPENKVVFGAGGFHQHQDRLPLSPFSNLTLRQPE